MCSLPTKSFVNKSSEGPGDDREQPYNGREIGPACLIQVSMERIATLHGFILDLDPGLLQDGEFVQGASAGPDEFFGQTVQAWLDRDPILVDAEVRRTGTGLHVSIWFDEPLVFTTDGQRLRWDGIARAIQALLPVDPDQPGITALTRPIGSVNSKNGATVTQLKQGSPVAAERVEARFETLRKNPFKTIMQVLLGNERVRPCPICKVEGTELAALDRVGRCYGSCGDVSLGQFYEIFLAPRRSASEQAAKSEDVDQVEGAATPKTDREEAEVTSDDSRPRTEEVHNHEHV